MYWCTLPLVAACRLLRLPASKHMVFYYTIAQWYELFSNTHRLWLQIKLKEYLTSSLFSISWEKMCQQYYELQGLPALTNWIWLKLNWLCLYNAVYSCSHCNVRVLYVQVYHSLFWPLEFTVPGRDNNRCYSKLICNKLDNVRLSLFFYSAVLFPTAVIQLTEPTPTNKLNSLLCPRIDMFMLLPWCCHTVGPSHRLPLPGSKCWRGNAGLRCSHEMWSHQGAAGWHHRHPPDLCWGKKTSGSLYAQIKII